MEIVSQYIVALSLKNNSELIMLILCFVLIHGYFIF